MRLVPGLVLLTLAAFPALAGATPIRPETRALFPPLARALPSRAARHATPGEVLVLLPPGSPLGSASSVAGLRASDPALADALTRNGLSLAGSLLPSAASGTRPFEAVRLVSGDPAFDPDRAAADLRASGHVLAAAPNLHMKLDFNPNDPILPSQWQFSTSAAGVRVRLAWDIEQGSPSVPIAIVDTGVDTGHPDLAANIWRNSGEIPGNGIDDDHDGLIDDVTGWDFGDGDNNPDPEPLIDPLVGIDEGWHGTFVAGLAAAATNNGIGGAGTAPNCSIMALKVADSTGDLPLAAITSAFAFAIAHHAKVINLSLGTTDTSGAGFFQALVNQAVGAGIVCVAAAGNDGTDQPNFPAACDSVLAVAATNASNLRASFSNWGDYVDIAAPGEAVWSCISRNYPYDDTSQLFFELLWGWDGVNPYMSNDGTSFSSPIAAGAAALVRSHFPALSPQQVIRQLVLGGDVRLYDNPIGPRLNIQKALLQPLAVEPLPARSSLSLAPPSPNPMRTEARFAFSLPRAGHVRLAVLDAQGRVVRQILDGARPAGPAGAAWDGRDARGDALAAGLYFAALSFEGERVVRRLALVH